MKLLRTQLVVETSERHLAAIPQTNLDRLEISSYLAQVATVTFYSEMEERLKEIVKSRFQHGGDTKLAFFLSKTNEQILKRMKRREISETVGLFGEECKIAFQTQFPGNQLDIYTNVIRDRHETSHGVGSDVTLSEVRAAMEIGERILVSVETVIA